MDEKLKIVADYREVPTKIPDLLTGKGVISFLALLKPSAVLKPGSFPNASDSSCSPPAGLQICLRVYQLLTARMAMFPGRGFSDGPPASLPVRLWLIIIDFFSGQPILLNGKFHF